MSIDIFSYRFGGTDEATLGPILEFVEPFVVTDPNAAPRDQVPRIQVPDPEFGMATAYVDFSDLSESSHLTITYNRPTLAVSLLTIVHRVATLGRQTLQAPYGFPVVTSDEARDVTTPGERDAPLVTSAEDLLDYWLEHHAFGD